MRILIKRVKIVNPAKTETYTGDIYIEGEEIKELGDDLFRYAQSADLVIDGQGLTAAPGLVDMHVHLRDPGFTHKENIHTACRAAAAGGVTSMLAMPNTSPAVDAPEIVYDILDRAKTADAEVYTAACITKGLKGEALCDIPALKKAGAIALSDDGMPVKNAKHLLQALVQAEALDMLVTTQIFTVGSYEHIQ